jgi:methionyl aminopeptidase
VAEHTLLVTADGVEILTARFPGSPGGPVPMPVAETNCEKRVEAAQ